MEKGTYRDTSEKEYRKWPAINYSSLASFAESQDHCLMEVPAKSYFEFGNAFELSIEDRAKGTEKFKKRFFTCDAPGAMPEDLAGWIEGKEDLETKYRLKKDGGLNMQSAKLHSWLDACRDNPGMMPMGKDQIEVLNIMVDNFMKMVPFADIAATETLEEILPIADFQVPIIWFVGKMRKKALLDCLIELHEKIYIFDIKTTADMKRFHWMLKDKYWIQEMHYCEGLSMIFPGKEIIWRFLVADKKAPNISQPFCMDQGSFNDMQSEYYLLCQKYQEWVDDGRPPKGWKNLERVRIFLN